MNGYGQTARNLTWGTASLPHLFTGESTDYSYRLSTTRVLDENEAGDNRALILHSKKAEISFSAKVASGSTDFLDLSAGASIAVSGVSGGVVLARRAVERWALLQPKVASVAAVHYMDITQSSPDAAGTNLSAFTPAQTQTGLVFPGGVLKYSTIGLTHASGEVQMLEIVQELELTEDDPSPDGKITSCVARAYKRMITLELLATDDPPAEGSTLSITGAPTHAADYVIEGVDTMGTFLRAKKYRLNAIWIPALSA